MLCSSRIITAVKESRRLKCARMGERRVAYRVLVGKPEGRRTLERPWRRWEDNIKIDHSEERWEHELD